jgi:two-component system, sensor histidine kinase PdtaS
MNFRTDSNCVELRPGTEHALWSENVCLRQKLEAANDAAALYPAMLREGNHRIKNSLQIVSSLLTLQAGREKGSAARDALVSASSRIQAVASMHDALQASEGHDWIDLEVALRMMCRSLEGMGSIATGVDVQVEAESLRTPVDFAQSILLIVNELVLNAMRHAFPDGRAGSVVIGLSSAEGQVRLIVSDNGIGLPPDYSASQGFGMKLVAMMTSKIKGALYIDSGAGTRITIMTPEPQPASAAQTAPARIEGLQSKR